MDQMKVLLYPTRERVLLVVMWLAVAAVSVPMLGFMTMAGGALGYVGLVLMMIIGAGFFLGLKIGSPFLLQIVYAYVIVAVATYLIDRKRIR